MAYTKLNLPNGTTLTADHLNHLEEGIAEGGVVFTPDVSEDGVLSWSNNGNLKNPDPVDLKGKTGDKGVGIVSIQIVEV